MNIIFMGTPDFAVGCLEKLVESKHCVKAVFSQPDKPKGRGYTLCPTPVKECALKNNIEVYQPKSMKDGEALELINSIDADIIVVVAYGKILPKEILQAKKYGCINVHGSLLPKYRGAAPIQRAVLDGEKETGVTIMQMDEGLDTGDMLLTLRTEIGINETSAELFDRLALIGADALIQALDLIESGKAQPVKQDDEKSTYAKMIDKSMCPIDWNKTAFEVHNQIRGLQTWPVAVTTYNGESLKIHSAVLSERTGSKAGEIIDNKGGKLVVVCGDGKCVEILEIQAQGKRKMRVEEYLCGHKMEKGTFFGG